MVELTLPCGIGREHDIVPARVLYFTAIRHICQVGEDTRQRKKNTMRTNSRGRSCELWRNSSLRNSGSEDLSNLVNAFDDIFYPQANLCSGGQSKAFDPKAYLNKLFDTVGVR